MKRHSAARNPDRARLALDAAWPRACALLFLAAAGLLAACGDTSATDGAGGAGGAGGTGTGTPGREPKVHRAAETKCPDDRGPGQAADMQPGDTCEADADCKSGTNGRCYGSIVVKNHCSYDECAADADCGGAQACECRNPASSNANTCVHGNCRLDADCGAGGYCSPSAVTLDSGCTLTLPQSSIGYFCHVAADACVDDSDCNPMKEEACLFSFDAMHWTCQPTPCAG